MKYYSKSINQYQIMVKRYGFQNHDFVQLLTHRKSEEYASNVYKKFIQNYSIQQFIGQKYISIFIIDNT